MTRIVELLIAINALAGIAAFLGVRRLVRSKLFRRRRELTKGSGSPEEEGES